MRIRLSRSSKTDFRTLKPFVQCSQQHVKHADDSMIDRRVLLGSLGSALLLSSSPAQAAPVAESLRSAAPDTTVTSKVQCKHNGYIAHSCFALHLETLVETVKQGADARSSIPLRLLRCQSSRILSSIFRCSSTLDSAPTSTRATGPWGTSRSYARSPPWSAASLLGSTETSFPKQRPHLSGR